MKKVSKCFPEFQLEEISFSLPAGFVLGLIGENGAGKSTLLKLIMKQYLPTSGDIVIFRSNFSQQAVEVKSRIGYLPEVLNFYNDFTLEENKNVYRKFYSNWQEYTFKALMNRFDLKGKEKFKLLSLGQKKRFGLALVFSVGADLLILDEPASGLDPIFRRELREIISDFLEDGKKSVVFSTHITSDLENIADYILFLKSGRIALYEDREKLADEYRIVKAPVEVIRQHESELCGVKYHEFSAEALCSNFSKAKELLPQSVIFEAARLEDIMYLFNKGGDDV